MQIISIVSNPGCKAELSLIQDFQETSFPLHISMGKTTNNPAHGSQSQFHDLFHGSHEGYIDHLFMKRSE